MKIQTINRNAKKILNIFFVSAVLLTTSLVTRANKASGHTGDDGDKTAEVKYIGSVDGERLFNVLYTNNSGARFSIKVQDAGGNLIFKGSFTDKKFDRKFKLETADTDKLVFTITNYGDNSTQAFEVNASTRLVEDIEVKELN
jgi:ABC-type cobalt transport system substrate-binding protein